MYGTDLEYLLLVITSVYRVVVFARIRQELPSIDGDRVENERTVGGFVVFPVLPLYGAFRTVGLLGWAAGESLSEEMRVDKGQALTIRACSVVCNFVEAVVGEGVGEACQGRFEHLLIDGVIEPLEKGQCRVSDSLMSLSPDTSRYGRRI